MAGSSSRRWLDEHFSDAYVKRAQQEGRRSRAFFKLLELDRKDKLFKPNMAVVDLGAAPGGWTEYAIERLNADKPTSKAAVFALDVLSMEPLQGARIIQGDFTEEAVLVELESLLSVTGHDLIDLVISDMAPNFSGVPAVDQPKAMLLAELALDFSIQHLRPGGAFVTKIFHGVGFDAFLAAAKQAFTTVVIRKPDASRDRSREVYLVAKNKR